MTAAVRLALDPVIVAVTDDAPRVLTVRADDGTDALPSAPLAGDHTETLERALRARVARDTGLALGYVEQLYTFGDRQRDPAAQNGDRCISVAYLALVREPDVPDRRARFHPLYDYLPWEDWRAGRPALVDQAIKPLLQSWAHRDAERRERVDLTFGLDGAPWDPERTLERYELLWEAGLVDEAGRDEQPPADARAIGNGGARMRGAFIDERGVGSPLGRPMALDHRRMLATALGRVRGKIKYRPVVFELLGGEFTLFKLQRTVEALAGSTLHKQNFRRLVETAGLVERTGRLDHPNRGRPAELFRFRHDVFRERPAPGVYLAGAWWSR